MGCATAPPPTDGPVAEGSNRSFSHTLTTSAPADAVWSIWTDVPGWPSWDTELEAASLDGPFGEGAQGHLIPAQGSSASFVIEEVEPGRAYTLATRLPAGWLRIQRTLTESDDGRLAFTHTVTFSGLGGRALSVRLGPRYRRALPLAMQQLRTLAEAQADASTGR